MRVTDPIRLLTFPLSGISITRRLLGVLFIFCFFHHHHQHRHPCAHPLPPLPAPSCSHSFPLVRRSTVFLHNDRTAGPTPRQHARHSALWLEMQPLYFSDHSHPTSTIPRQPSFTTEQHIHSRQVSGMGFQQQTDRQQLSHQQQTCKQQDRVSRHYRIMFHAPRKTRQTIRCGSSIPR